MASGPQDVAVAQARAAAARAQLNVTVERLQARLEPAVLARNAVETVSGGGQRALAASRGVARRNPAVLAGAAALIGLLLVRKPLARRLFGRSDEPAAARRVRIHKADPLRRNPTQ